VTTRRDFLKTAGTGLLLPLFFSRVGCDTGGDEVPLSPGPYLEIDRRGRVTIWLTKSEMGQGVWTALPMIVAEELEAEWSSVRVRQADNAPAFGDQMTGGSVSVHTMWEPLRLAGAQAREMLVLAAARRWSVAPAECRARSGTVRHVATGRRLSYGKLVDAASELPVPQNPALKDPSEFRLIGASIARLDAPAKATGAAIYGIDVRIPDMRVAVLSRPPGFGHTEPEYDAGRVRAMPGVTGVFPVPSGVAVVAEDTWTALRGRRALAVRWSGASTLDSDGISGTLLRRAEERPGAVARQGGDAGRMLNRAERAVEAEYHLPFLAHATMEPMNCVAHVRGDRCEIWAPTQAPTRTAAAVAEALDIPPDHVTLNTTLLGGGFGRRLLHDFAVEAALVSRAAGGPVQVVWTREDDLQAGWYRPASLHRMRGAVAGGKAVAWKHLIVTPSIDGVRVPTIQADEFNQFAVMGFANLAYAIPNLRIEYARVNTEVPVAWWRSVYSSQLVFANESFVDELATAAGVDPLEFRLAMLPPGSREREVLSLAAERAGWGRALPAGCGLGIAMHEYFGTVAAAVAEVAAAPGSEFRVVRLTLAVHCGLLINPRIAAAQIEGGALFGLSAALHESVTIREGAVVQSNFHDYRLLRMGEAPPVEVHFLPSASPPTGVGEPGTPHIAPAVANALFAATGRRERRLPLVRVVSQRPP
jgi:isoquinoline 1-oxidoreductase beta subunit